MSEKKKRVAGWWGWLWETFSTIVIAFLLALFIRAFFFQAYFIPSGSMIPTLDIRARLIVNKLAYGLQNPLNGLSEYSSFLGFITSPLYRRNIPFSNFKYFVKFPRQPKRFSIVIFRSPQGWGKDLIKRVIGLPGETIALRNGAVYINNRPLKEIHQMIKDQANFGPILIPENNYFVMGDNRPDSNDSRYWGYLPAENIQGEAMFIFWPVNRIGWIK